MPRKKKFNQEPREYREEVISDEEFFRRVHGTYERRASIVPSYGPVPLEDKARFGYGKDVPNMENPPKWGIRMWSSVRRDPPTSPY